MFKSRVRCLLLFAVLFSVQALGLPKDFLSRTPAEQAAYQYQKMQESRYTRWVPGFIHGGCMQALGFLNAPAQVLHTFAWDRSERAWWARWLGGKMFHTQGVATEIELVVQKNYGFDQVVFSGMGRLSLGAPPVDGKYAPGFAFLVYRQDQAPIGIHAIAGLDPVADTRFFAQDFTNRLRNPDSKFLQAGAFVAGLAVREPLRMDHQHLVDLMEEEGVQVSEFRKASHITLVPVSDRDEKGFLESRNWRRSLERWRGNGGILFQLVFHVGDERHVGGFIRLTDPDEKPFVASSYGDYRFHIPHTATGPKIWQRQYWSDLAWWKDPWFSRP